MTLKGKVLALAIVSALVAGSIGASAALQAVGRSQETGPVYSLEGAWYGMTTFDGGKIPPTPTMDTFTSYAQRPGIQGSFLCTIPAEVAGGQSPSGHGNWVRVGTNTYAYTAVRTMMQGGVPVGWARFWGTITPTSDEELTGTINVQYFLLDGTTPFSRVFSGTIERRRVDVTFEQ